MNGLRILLVADVPPDPDAGAAGTEFQTAAALRRLGHTVDAIWTDALPRRIAHNNLRYLLELPRGFRDAVRTACARHRYDVVHVNQPAAWLAARDHRASRRGGVFVNRSHGWELRAREALAPWRLRYGQPEWRFPRGVMGRPLQYLLARQARAVCRDADGVIVYCGDCRRFVMERHGVSGDRVAAIPAAAPDAYLADAPPPMTPERLKRLLYVSQFAFFKAPMVVAAAASAVLERCPDCTFTWVCQAEHHAAAAALLAPTARARTRFLPWRPQAELRDVYDAHGIFFFLSFYEGFGKVFLEAMARGLCVVASDTGGMNDVIVDRESGLLVPAGDAPAAADAAVLLLNRPREAAAMGGTARRRAAPYTWERCARETEAFYRQLLALKAAAGPVAGVGGKT